MSYTLETTTRFDKAFRKLDRYTQRMLKAWITRHLAETDDPRARGKALTADPAGLWRYRIGDYRMICLIQDDRLVILALTIGHRRDIYKK